MTEGNHSLCQILSCFCLREEPQNPHVRFQIFTVISVQTIVLLVATTCSTIGG